MSDFKEAFLKRLSEDDKYRRILESVDPEIGKRIDETVRALMGDICQNLGKLQEAADDPETIAKLKEELKKRG